MTRPVVCFLTGTLDALAGAERVTATIANALAARGYTVHIVALWSTHSCYPLHPSIQMHALHQARPSFKRRYLATVRSIRSYLKQHRVDVLVGVDTMLAWFTAPAAIGLGVRQIAWEHCNFDEDLGRRSRRFARRLAAYCFDSVVVLTERDRLRWQHALNPRAQLITIPNPLPFDIQDQASASLSHAKLVLAVGRLVPAKGFDVLLRAWQQVVSHHPDWKLRIVGDGESRHALEALRDQLGIAASVELPGATSDVLVHYRAASLFCLSSHYEGFGLVIIEAMACGVPVIATDCPTGPREILENGAAGVLVPPDDPAALADAISQLIENPAQRALLAIEGRRVAARYPISMVASRWELLLGVTTGIC